MQLNVILKEDSKMIDEVVVVGYGVQKKENLTGSVAAVNFNDVANMPVANTTNMLQGRLPGVMLTGMVHKLVKTIQKSVYVVSAH